MATEKRQRQDQRRAVKVQEETAIATKQAAKQKRNKFVWLAIPAVLLVGFALLKGLTGSSKKDTAASTATTKPAVTTTTLPKPISVKPAVDLAGIVAPKATETKDLVIGTGPEVDATSDLRVNVVGVALSTKTEFQSSWGDRLFPITNLQASSTIEGWKKGLVGMKQGGRRRLVVPASEAKGVVGVSGVKADETLVYIIDAVEVTTKATTTKAS